MRHTFTHFHFEITVWAAQVPAAGDGGGDESEWWPFDRLGDAGLPTVMRKIADHALKHGADA